MTDAKEIGKLSNSRFGGNDDQKNKQKNTSSTNDVSTAYGVSNSSSHNSQYEHTSSYSLLANQSSCPQLDHEDLEQLDEFDLEEMDLKWQEPVGFDKTKVECYSCHKTGHFARECRSKGNQDSRRRDTWNTGNKDKENGRRSGKQEDSKALVTLDGEGVDWTSHSEDEQENYALMPAAVQGYIVLAHQQSQLWYEEKIRFMKIDLDDKTDVLTYHKKLLAEAEKEKEDLKAKVEKWHNSSKNLNILLNSQMSAKDKAGLGEETHEYMPEPVVNEPKVVSESKVWFDAPIIEEYESDSEDEHVVIGDPKDITGTKSPNAMVDQDYPQRTLQNKGIVDSGCSRHMTGNKAYLAEYQDFNGGLVAFGGSKGYITGKGKIKIGKLDFEDVCFVKELQHFNLFSVSQMCDKKNKVFFTDSECLVVSPEFKLPDENQDYFVLQYGPSYTSNSQNHKNAKISSGRKLPKETEDLLIQVGAAKASSTNIVNTASTPVCTASPYGGLSFTDLTNNDQDDSEIPALEEIYNNPTDDLPYRKKAIGTKWVYRNKKDERGVVVRNKARFIDPKYPKKKKDYKGSERSLWYLHQLQEHYKLIGDNIFGSTKRSLVRMNLSINESRFPDELLWEMLTFFLDYKSKQK
ncbi:ribonuclease H-like domain-containing protein [Tanacetum coccineum]|uniref:Ribonuclease H-like domain-containing protein n=1 Tax=Tanacetum coccineum TaxID=301880 RepID=A0ABQ5A6X5_9ASTR